MRVGLGVPFSATVAGSLASWITNPLDLAKLRLQVSRAKAAAKAPASPVTGEVYTGFWQALNLIYKVEGVKGLFRGSVARVSKNGCHRAGLLKSTLTPQLFALLDMSRSCFMRPCKRSL
jgi:hypothetical protein